MARRCSRPTARRALCRSPRTMIPSSSKTLTRSRSEAAPQAAPRPWTEPSACRDRTRASGRRRPTRVGDDGKLWIRRRSDRWPPRPFVLETGASGGIRSTARSAMRSWSERGSGTVAGSQRADHDPCQGRPRIAARASRRRTNCDAPRMAAAEKRRDRSGVVKPDRRLVPDRRQEICEQLGHGRDQCERREEEQRRQGQPELDDVEQVTALGHRLGDRERVGEGRLDDSAGDPPTASYRP